MGRGPAPSLVLKLVMRLPPESLTTALASGGREFFGWGTDRHLLADIFDALNMNTRATGMWDKKPPSIPEYPRPKPKPKVEKKKSDEPKPKRTVKDLFSMFQKKG